MAVYDNALMLQTDDVANTVYVIVKALLAIGLWGVAAVGHLSVPLTWWERLLAMTAAFFLVVAVPVTDTIGLVLGALAAALHVWRNRASADAGAS